MIYTYLITTLRNLFRHRVYAVISILGLALGIAGFAVAFLLMLHEVSYDDFHQKADRIVRVTETLENDKIGEHSASLPFPTGPAIVKAFPERVETCVRFFNFQTPYQTVSAKNVARREKHFYFADSTFFRLFDFPLKVGNPKTALIGPGKVILSRETAMRYFGDENPIGQILVLDKDLKLTVSGVFDDLPVRTHFRFDFICSFSTIPKILSPSVMKKETVWNPCWTYFLLQEGTSEELFESDLAEFTEGHFPAILKNNIRLNVQNLTDIHLYSDLDYEMTANGNMHYVIIFTGLGLFILIVAGINYMNLATARAPLRTKEVMARKMIGASKKELVAQFLLESVFIALLSVFAAFIILELASPYLTDLSGNPFNSKVFSPITGAAVLILTGLSVGFLSGIYPAVYLSGFTPGSVQRGMPVTGKERKNFRHGLVILQFVISGIMLTGSFVTLAQLDFMKNSRLGFDKEQIIIVPITNTGMNYFYKDFKIKLLTSPTVSSVTSMENVLGQSYQTHPFGVSGKNDGGITFVPSLFVSHDFIKTFNIRILAGEDFGTDMGKKPENQLFFGSSGEQLKKWLGNAPSKVIVNESMRKHLGFKSNQEAVGKIFSYRRHSEKIVGVSEDFHYSSLRKEVSPFVLNLSDNPDEKSTLKYIAVKSNADCVSGALTHLQTVWNEFLPNTAFDYFFLEENLAEMYLKEERLGKLSAIFSTIVIFIAGMGLYGLTSFVVERRRREIGIRKALGTGNFELVILLSTEFFKPVAYSLLIGFLPSWAVAEFWLQAFPYAVGISPEMFLKTGLLLLSTAGLTVVFHAWKTVVGTPLDCINAA